MTYSWHFAIESLKYVKWYTMSIVMIFYVDIFIFTVNVSFLDF